MRPKRFVITDRSWEIIELLLPRSKRDRDRTAKDNRLFLEVALWKVRVGGSWRGLLAEYYNNQRYHEGLNNATPAVVRQEGYCR